MTPKWVAACAIQSAPVRCRPDTQTYYRNEQPRPTTALNAAYYGNHLCCANVFDAYQRIPINVNRRTRLWFALLEVVWTSPVQGDEQITADGQREVAGHNLTLVRRNYLAVLFSTISGLGGELFRIFSGALTDAMVRDDGGVSRALTGAMG